MRLLQIQIGILVLLLIGIASTFPLVKHRIHKRHFVEIYAITSGDSTEVISQKVKNELDQQVVEMNALSRQIVEQGASALASETQANIDKIKQLEQQLKDKQWYYSYCIKIAKEQGVDVGNR